MSSSLRFVPLFTIGRLYTRVYQGKTKRSFNFTFRYIDDVLSLNNSKSFDFDARIYPFDLGIKNTTDTAKVLRSLLRPG
jgi:hypothetical protein